MGKPPLYTSICAIAKDEPDVVDWVNYHFAIGFDKIWLFDNKSRQSLRELLRDYIRLGIVEVHDITLEESPQLSAYAAFLQNFGKLVRWTAFIDLDEYINPKRDSDIADLLDRYVEYPALAIHWKMFGSNGHLSRPAERPIEAYTECLHEHPLLKSIIQPAMTKGVISPHHFAYEDGKWCVNEHRIPVLGARSYHTAMDVQINHYYYKSQQDFEAKKARGLAIRIENRPGYDMQEFYRQAGRTCEQETSILRYLKKLEIYERMGPAFIANEIRQRVNVNMAEIKDDTSDAILHGREETAIRKIRQALRYSDDPILYVFLSKLYSLKSDYETAFASLSEGFLTAGENAESRQLLYDELGQLYERMGCLKQQAFIKRELLK